MATYEQLIESAEAIRQSTTDESVTAPAAGQLYKDIINYIQQRKSEITTLNQQLASEVASRQSVDQQQGQSIGTLNTQMAAVKTDIADLKEFKSDASQSLDELSDAIDTNASNLSSEVTRAKAAEAKNASDLTELGADLGFSGQVERIINYNIDSTQQTIDGRCQSQSVNLTWHKSTEGGSGTPAFTNLFNNPNMLPLTIPTGYYKLYDGEKFVNLGSGNPPSIFAMFLYISLGDGDTISSNNFEDIGGGWMATYWTGTGQRYIKSSLGNSTLLYAYCIDVESIYPDGVPNKSDIYQAFKGLQIVPGQDYDGGIANPVLFVNSSTVPFNTATVTVVGNDVLRCQNGSVEFTAKYSESVQKEKSTFEQLEDFENRISALENGDTPSASPSPAASADWSSKKWAVVGDSLTDASINATKKYHKVIKDLTGIQLQVLGVGGTGYTAGSDSGKAYIDRVRVIDTDADIVTLFGSVNDWKNYANNTLCPEIGNATDVYDSSKTWKENTFCANLNHTFDVLFERVPTAQVIVFSAMPYYGVGIGHFQDARDALESVCKTRHIPYVDMFDSTGFYRIMNDVNYAKFYTTEGENSSWSSVSDYPSSFGHPNNNAHEKIIAPKFLQELKKWILSV